MASQKRKPKRFRIEMGWGGLFSLAVGSFIMLLWMFVLGFWAGNRLLGPITVAGGGAKGALGGSGAAAGWERESWAPIFTAATAVAMAP